MERTKKLRGKKNNEGKKEVQRDKWVVENSVVWEFIQVYVCLREVFSKVRLKASFCFQDCLMELKINR